MRAKTLGDFVTVVNLKKAMNLTRGMVKTELVVFSSCGAWRSIVPFVDATLSNVVIVRRDDPDKQSLSASRD